MHPPPNISGSLTIGHCLQLSLEDTLVRWHRMRGFNTLFQPGYDHAGISTWASIGRTLAQEGKSQRDLGREGFDAYVQEWLRALRRHDHEPVPACSAPRSTTGARASRWTRATTAPSCAGSSTSTSAAGSTARTGSSTGARATRRRSPTSRSSTRTKTTRCRTSAIRSPTAPATSRSPPCGRRRSSPTSRSRCIPTTSATASSSARRSIVPFVERRVPVIADERVEREFGTGALKITPGHDPTDFEIGRDHGLPELTVIGPDGRMNDAAGELAGLTQEEAAQARARLGARSAGSSRSASTTATRSVTASAATAASSRSSCSSGGWRWRSSRRLRSPR